MSSTALLSVIAPRVFVSFARAKTVCSIVSGTPESVIFSLMVSFLYHFRALCLPANEPRDAL